MSIKAKTFKVMDQCLSAQVVTPLLFKFLIIIEGLEMVYFSLSKSLFKSAIYDSIYQGLSYIEFFDSFTDSTFFYFLFYMVFEFDMLYIETYSFQVVAMILFFLSYFYRRATFAPKILGVYGMLLNSILIIPFSSIIYVTILCREGSPVSRVIGCYEGLYFIHFSLSIVGYVMMVLLVFLFKTFVGDLNPFSKFPLASPQNKGDLVKLLVKLFVPIYIAADYNQVGFQAFSIIISVLYLSILILRYRSPQYFNEEIFELRLGGRAGGDAVLGVAGGGGALLPGLRPERRAGHGVPPHRHPLQERALLPPLELAQDAGHHQVGQADQVHHALRDAGVLPHPPHQSPQPHQEPVSHRTPTPRIQIHGLLRVHIKDCMKPGCVCSDMYFHNKDNQDSHWFHLVKQIIIEGINKYKKYARLHLLNAHIHHDQLKNSFKSLYELDIAVLSKPTVFEDFMIFRMKRLIEQEMIDNDNKTSELKGINVNLIVDFQNMFVQFHQSIDRTVNLYLEFWRELMEENPEIQKLQLLGTQITVQLEDSNMCFQQLQRINSNNINCLQIYGNFLSEIVNDEIESTRVLEKAEYLEKSNQVNKQFMDNDRKKYDENSNMCIIICSGNQDNLSIVTNCNKEITRILDYQKQEIIGQKVNRIMPKIYGEVHDTFIINFLETSESKVLGLERLVMALTKQGYILPCTLMIKVLPNLNEGISLIGFLKEIDQMDSQVDHIIIYNQNSNQVLGISKNCFTHYGIPASLVYGNNGNNSEFLIDTIIPAVILPENQEALKTAFLTCTLDTTALQDNFLVEQVDSFNEPEDLDDQQEDGAEQEKEKMKPQTSLANKYQKSEIQVRLIDEQEFCDQKIHILTFVDSNETKLQQDKNKKTMREQIDEKEKDKMEQEKVNDHKRGLVQESVEEGELDGEDNENELEDIRLIKEFKTLMNRKSDSNNIKLLAKIMVMQVVALIIIVSVDLTYRLAQNSNTIEGENAIYYSYMRINTMSDVIFYSRMLDMLANGRYVPNNGQTVKEVEVSIKANLSDLVDSLQRTQFQIIKAKILLEQRQDNVPEDPKYNVSFLLQSKQAIYQENIFNDAFFQFLTSASALRNSTLASFQHDDLIENTQKNLYYIIHNGYLVLRKGAEDIAKDFYKFYLDLINSYRTIFIVLLSLAIFFIALSLLFLVPIVFQVHKINSQVLSLFGLIDQQYMTKLIEKCEKFKDQYLQDVSAIPQVQNGQNGQDQDKQEEKNNEEPKQEENQKDKQNQSKDVSVIHQIRQHDDPLIEKQDEIDKSEIRDKIQDRQDKNMDIPVGLIQGQLKQNADQQRLDDEKQEEQDNLRAQKLLNTRNTSKIFIVFQFIVISFVFVGYFIGSYILQLIYLENVDTLYQHLELISWRPAAVKFTTYLTFDQIVRNEEIMEGDYDLRVLFKDKIYDNERNVFSSILENFPASFEDYKNFFQQFNYQNLCNQQFSYENFTMDESCAIIEDGLLKKGLRTAIVSIALKSNEIIQESQTDDLTFIDSFLYLLKYIDPSLNYLIQRFNAAVEKYLKEQDDIEIIKFSCFLLVLLFIFVVLWMPFKQRLSKQIWRTKGMLNMIPLDVIQNQESIKVAFLSGDIIKGVR